MLLQNGDERAKSRSLNSKGKRAMLTKADLVEKVSTVVGVPRQLAAVIVEEIVHSMVRALRSSENIEIRGFGSFRTRQRRARIGRNPKTGVPVAVPPKTIPYFTPSKELKELVNRI